MALDDRLTPGPEEAGLLARFGTSADALLGAGGESRVFALDEARVLRIFHASGQPRERRVDELLAGWARSGVDVPVPVVLRAGRTGSQEWTIDRRLPGRSLLSVLQEAPRPRRRSLLRSALDVVRQLRRLPLPSAGFCQVGVSGAPGFATLVDLLDERMDTGIALGGGALARLVPDLAAQRGRMRELLRARDVRPAFVHADVYPGNLMSDGERCTGVVDVSVHALAADPVIDEVGLVCMLARYDGCEDDERWLDGVLRQELGDQEWLVDVYRRFHAAYYSMDPALHAWCAAEFRRPWR